MADLAVTLDTWLLALAPLAVLLVLLLVLRWSAGQAAGAGFLVAVLIAVLWFGAGLDDVAVATTKGVWDGIFVLYVIWPALLLFETVDNAGAFRVFRRGLERVSQSDLILVLVLGWLLASFLQSVAGFGTPIAIVAPVLIGLGVKPVSAVVVPLIGQAWANTFGTLGVPWLALTRVVEFEDPARAAFLAAALLVIPNLLTGLTIAWLYGRGPALKRALPFVLTISAVQAGGQLFVSRLDPSLAALAPNTAALAVAALLLLIPAYRRPDGIESRIMLRQEKHAPDTPSTLSLPIASLPYVVLLTISVVALLVPAVSRPLSEPSIGLELPSTETALGVERQAEDRYGAVRPLTHPGTFLLVSAVFGYAVFRRKGAYGDRPVRGILSDVAKNAVPASISVLGFLAIARMMDTAGMTGLLALGLAIVTPPWLYAAASNSMGAIGTFMTSSTTASNVLFGPLQQEAAVRLGLPPDAVLASQTAGAAAGDAIAPANIVLGTGTARIPGREPEVLERTLPWLLLVTVLMGAAAAAVIRFL